MTSAKTDPVETAKEKITHRRWAGTQSLLRDRSATLGLALLLVFGLGALAAPWLAPADPSHTDVTNRFASLSLEHPLGTDQLGRDILSRLLYGSRLSIGMAVAATLGITVLGTAFGLIAGMYGRGVDTLIMRIVDILQALPGIILALAIAGILGAGLTNLLLAIVIVSWAGYARVVRGMTLSIREREFVVAAQALGVRKLWVGLRHILPNLVGPIIVLSTLDMGMTLLAISALSFLGLGAQPPTPEWGAMLAEAGNYIAQEPMLILYPGAAITLLVLAFNLLGDGLRDAIDPQLRREVRD